MAGNTSPDNIVFPTLGDTIENFEDVFAALAGSVQDAFNARRLVREINVHSTAAPGWSIKAQSMVIRDGVAMGWIQAERTGGAINVGSSGNIGNQSVAYIAEEYAPFFRTVANGPFSTGRLTGGELGPDYSSSTAGIWRLNAVGGSNDIAKGEVIELSATWLVSEQTDTTP